MNILFETNYTRNIEWSKEVYLYHYFKRKKAVVFWLLCACYIICSIVDLFIKRYDIIVIAPFLILYTVLYLRSYFRDVNITIKRDIESTGGEVKVNSVVTDTYIENTSSTGSVTKLYYCNVKSAAVTKNFILLFTDSKLIYSFRKDSFTKGNYNDFIIFLRYKGIRI